MKANVVVISGNGTKAIPIEMTHALWIEIDNDDNVEDSIKIILRDDFLELDSTRRISIEPRAANSIWIKTIK